MSLPAEPPGKPKITGVGSLSLLQQIFLTQKLNQGLLHCRQILYELTYMGSPSFSDKWHIDQLCSSFIIYALGFILRKSPLKNIYLCTIISCKHSSVNGHLGCFHVLVIVKSVATNIGVHATLSVMLSWGYMPTSGIVGSYGSSIPSF